MKSGVFKPLARRHDVTFVLPEPGFHRVTVDVESLDIGKGRLEHLPVHAERMRLWRRMLHLRNLAWRSGDQYAALRRHTLNAIGWKAAVTMIPQALPGMHGVTRRRLLRKIAGTPNDEMIRYIEAAKPDLIFHPCVLEGSYINDLVEVAGASSIPLVVIMNSWDNPATKQAMAGEPDLLLVWGEQTEGHAVKYVGLPKSKIRRFGAAQFEVYGSPPRVSRADFCRRHGIAPGKTVVLYAGSSKGTDEYAHLSRLDEAVERGGLADVEIVYRPHPWGMGGKGGHRILDANWKHVHIESSMLDYLEHVRKGVNAIHFADYRDTHDVLSSVDALVSPLSTIILEALLHKKPAMCFLPVEERDAAHFMHDKDFVHFREMFEMDEVITVRGLPELVPGVAKLVERARDPAFADRVSKAVDYFIEPFDRPWSERIISLCEEIAGRGAGIGCQGKPKGPTPAESGIAR